MPPGWFLVAITVPINTSDHVFTIFHNLYKTNVNLPKSPSKFWTGDIQSSRRSEMVSTLKSETARANGAKSRGPTTAEGKEKSSRNAIKRGLTAGNGNILLDCEDPGQFDEVLNKLFGIHEPATPAEKDLVEEMVACRWRTRRMWTIETGLLNAEILSQAAKTDTPDPNIHLTTAFRSLTDDSRSLALASRYEARLQRLYDRAYKTLRELQQARKSQEPTPPHTVLIRWVKPNEE